MKIGILSSSGGSAFSEMVSILDNRPNRFYEYSVVTDRACGIEEYCSNRGIECRRFEYLDNRTFSEKARSFFDERRGVDVVLLFLLRLVTEDLFSFFPTFNIHPSLLPAFKGLDPVRRAIGKRVKFMGATLHLLDNSIDGGPILAQVCMPVSRRHSEEELNKFSFVQKVYLSLVLVEMIETGSIAMLPGNSDFVLKREGSCSDRCNPLLGDAYLHEGVLRLQEREKVEVIR